jgi:hypothetical protein
VDEEARGWVDRQHLGDDPTSELGAELFGARDAIWTTLSLVVSRSRMRRSASRAARV